MGRDICKSSGTNYVTNRTFKLLINSNIVYTNTITTNYTIPTCPTTLSQVNNLGYKDLAPGDTVQFYWNDDLF